MDIFGYYFDIPSPYKPINLRKTYNSKWITKGTKISSKRMRFLNSVKTKFSLSREEQTYIKKIQYHIQKSTEGSQKKKIMISISRRQQTNKKWQLINTQVGKCSSSDKEIELKQKQA
jgi:hypothetical protein